ncbi:MAG: hypothetical protein HYU42_06855 [Candidatus Rokubacteria bacterium]|nr:hypothetical protein [Candidatus Rokubacteria bacterium]
MIAAMCARKSTEQNISDEEKSVTREAERAEVLQQRKTVPMAASTYLHGRSQELCARGTELRTMLETVKDVFPKAPGKKAARKAVA